MSDIPRDPGAAEELDSLLGAYALDALDAGDRARVDSYLERDADARAEVDELRETAASLALMPTGSLDAPAELWERISGEIAQDRERDERAREVRGGRARSRPRADELAARRIRRARVSWIAAAAAVIVLVVLGAQIASLHSRLDRANRFGPTAMAAAFDRAVKADGALQVALTGKSGATLARVVLLPDGTGYLRGDHLAPLPSDRTYQLWAVTGPKNEPVTVSAGVLGSDPRAVPFRASGPVRAFAVTVEHEGGVVRSAQTPIAQAAIA
jgi:anti-sigma-K factor RskA